MSNKENQSELGVEEMRAAVISEYHDARVTDTLGLTVIVSRSCVVGNSGMAYHLDGAEEAAWADAYSKLPSPPVESEIGVPSCPRCRAPLNKVRRPSGSMLNEDQFAATRAGDWFCKCSNNSRGNHPYAYFWNSELPSPPPKSVEEMNDNQADVRVVRPVDRSVLGQEETNFVPLPITDDRDLDYVDPRLKEEADLIISKLPSPPCGAISPAGNACTLTANHPGRDHMKLDGLRVVEFWPTAAQAPDGWTPITIPSRQDIKAARLVDGKVQFLVRIEGMKDYVLDDLHPDNHLRMYLEASYWQQRCFALEAEMKARKGAAE